MLSLFPDYPRMSKKTPTRETAESLARKQREISVSEFFLKNRHLLGFDNPRKALLTTVKEAVDNALDACEEASIVPEISVDIRQVADNRFCDRPGSHLKTVNNTPRRHALALSHIAL